MRNVSLSLADSISIGLIETPLDGSLWLSHDTPCRTAIRQLDAHHFDQAPVLRNGVPTGYVLLSDLRGARGSIRSCQREILPEALASADTPLGNALPWMAEGGFLFVLRDREVSGFVVPTDLNKQPGRAFLYLALTEFELALAAAVRRSYPDQEQLLDPSILGSKELSLVRGRMKRHAKLNQEADIVAEFDLSHLLSAATSDDDLRVTLESAGGLDLPAISSSLRPLRNAVAHAAKEMLGEVTIRQVATAVEITERLTAALSRTV